VEELEQRVMTLEQELEAVRRQRASADEPGPGRTAARVTCGGA